MNAIAPQLSDADIDNVAAYFNSLAVMETSDLSETAQGLAENKITFPDDYQDTFTLYSKVSQAGPKRVRHNYGNEAALQALDDQGMLADGAFIVTEIYSAKLDDSGNPVTGDDGHFVADKLVALAVMEKRHGYGDAIPEILRNGDWIYAIFSPEKERRPFNHAACLACHKPLHDADYLFSYQDFVDRAK